MHFAATRKSRREVRVGGQCGAVAVAEAKELARGGQLRAQEGWAWKRQMAWLRGSIRIKDSSLTFGLDAWIGGWRGED